MSAYDTLRAAMAATKMDQVIVMRTDLAGLLAEVDKLRAAAPVKKPRAKKAAASGKGFAAAADPLPDWLPLEAWAEFLAMRVKIKKPATDYAQKLLIKKLTAFRANDLDPGVILNQSIVNSWQDLYAPKEPSTARASQWPPRLPVADQNAANNAEALRLMGQPMFDPNDGMTFEAMP